jgi:pimeloyl-ACP methyl ester carboxylesterase
MMDRDLSRTTVESFLRSIASLRRTDLIPMIPQIKVPTMGMYGDKDVIVHPLQWQPLQTGIPHAVIERFPEAGHFIMLEEPTSFSQKLKTFLDKDIPVP